MTLSVFDCDNASVTSKQIESWTNVDPTLSMIKQCIISGIWSTVCHSTRHGSLFASWYCGFIRAAVLLPFFGWFVWSNDEADCLW